MNRTATNSLMTWKKFAMAVLLLVVSGITTRTAQADTIWTGNAGTSDWNTADNWDSGVPTGSGLTTINQTANVTMSAPGETLGLNVSAVGTSFDDAAVLNISQDLSSGYNKGVAIGVDLTTTDETTKHYAKVVHTSGTLTVGTGQTNATNLGIARNADTVASYDFGGAQGSAPVIDVKNNLDVGTSLRCSGTMSLKDYGTVTIGGDAVVSNNNSPGELSVEGGDLDIDVAGNFSLGVS